MQTVAISRIQAVIARAAAPAERRAQGCAFRGRRESDASLLEQRESEAVRLGYGGDRHLFDRVLELRGWTADQYRAGLIEVEVADSGALPEWARTLEKLYGGCEISPPLAGRFQPFLAYAVKRLTGDAADRLESGALNRLLASLEERLSLTASAALHSRLAESDDRSVAQTWLSGSTVSLEDWLHVFEVFPVLARLLALLLDQWCTGVKLFLHRLDEDWNAIQSRFFPEESQGRLATVEPPPAADYHSGGQQVLLLTFSGGRQLFYKPRDLRLGAAFLEILGKLEESGLPCCPRRRLLIRPDFAWDERMQPGPCRNLQEVRGFYQKLGVLVRVTELFNSRDLHRDNLLAVGPSPVLVDLETLVQPSLAQKARPEDPLANFLLTLPFLGDPGYRAVDLGVLAGHRTQPSPYRTLPSVLRPVSCLAFLEEEIPEPHEYFDEIEFGYAACEDWLAGHGPSLESSIGLMEGLPFRSLYRQTEYYARLIQSSLRPELLREGWQREAYLEQVYRSSLRWEHPPQLAASEIEALSALDTPIFFGRIGEQALLCENGSRIENYFESHFLEVLRERLTVPVGNRSGRRVLRTVLAVLRRSACPERPPCAPPSQSGAVDWLAESLRAGELLLAGVNQRPWIGLHYTPWADCWRLGSIPPDLLGGKAGWAVVCAELARAAKDPRYRKAAVELVEELRLELERLPEKVAKVRRSPRENFFCGAYTGWGGQIYAMQRCARLLGREDWKNQALDCLEQFPLELCLQRAPHGWISGLAGLLPALRSGLGERPALREFHQALLEALASSESRRTDPIPADSNRLFGFPGGEPASHPSCLDHLEDALDAAALNEAEQAARALLSLRTATGSWFAWWGVSDEHHLCALTGVGTIALAFLRLHSQGRVASLRRLE